MVQYGERSPKPGPRFIEPMECKRVPKLPEGDNWLYEIKHDGYRVIALVEGKTVKLHSMSGLDYSSDFRHITFALKELKLRGAVFDGEVVALDEQGRPSFQELQNRRHSKRPIVYYIFDVLHFNGKDLLEEPLLARKEKLSELGMRFKKTSEGLRTDGRAFMNILSNLNFIQLSGDYDSLKACITKRNDFIPIKLATAFRFLCANLYS